MANINNAFQPEDGINLNDLVGIFAGVADPSVGGETAPIGSLFIRSVGQLFQKVGPTDYDWTVFSAGSTGQLRISSTDTASDYLNLKLLTSASLTQTVNNAGGNETLTLDLANVGSAGTYTQVTTNSKGQVISGSNPGFITANQNITLSGDVSGTGSTAITTTLNNTTVTPGSYTLTNITVNSQGRITSAANGTAITTLTGGIETPTYIQFDTTASIASNPGLLTWNGTEGTFEFGLKGGNVTLQIGQEQVVRVYNDSGSDLVDGQVVYISGALANRLAVKLASNTSELTSDATLGVCTEHINANQEGFVTTSGLVHDLNTSAFSQGDRLWLGAGGTFTNVKPAAPLHTISIGFVVRSHATVGMIYVDVVEFHNLDDINDVSLTSVANGDILTYNSIANAWFNNSTSATLTAILPSQTGQGGKFLTTDGSTVSWASVPQGTVTSVSATGSTGLSVSGSPVTTSGTLSFTLDGDLQALAGLTGTGLVQRTGDDTYALKTLQGTTNQITVTDSGGNLTVALADNPVIPGTASMTLPAGTSVQRPGMPVEGDIRANTSTGNLEYYDGTQWVFFKDSITMGDEGEPTGHVSTTASVMSFNESTRVFTIQPAATSYTVYVKGVRFVKTGVETITIANTQGRHFIHFDATGSLVDLSGVDFHGAAFTCFIYWDTVNQLATIVAEERHGVIMDGSTHEYLHNSLGTQWVNGLLAGDYTLTGDGTANSDATISITNGAVRDEDILIPVIHNTTPSAMFEQVLTPVAKMPIIHKRSGGAWEIHTATDYPVELGTDRVVWNNGANDWALEDADEGYFVAAWLISTNDIRHPIVSMLGQRQDATLEDAMTNNTVKSINLTGFPPLEFKFLYRVIYQTSSTYTNAVHAKLVDVYDVRAVQIQLVALPTTVAHSELSGLAGDDHLQYVHTGTARTITAIHTFNPGAANAPFTLGANAQTQLVSGLNADLLDGLHASSFQPADTDLDALAATTGTGLYTITGSGTSATRTLTAGSSKISISNGNGVAGNPTIDVAEANLDVGNMTGTLGIAHGGTNLTSLGTANQVLGVNAGATAMEYKTITAGSGISVSHGTGSITITATASGTVSSVAATGSTGLTVGGSPITTTGTLTFTLDTGLQNLASLATTGVLVATDVDTWAVRSITGTAGNVTVSNGDGVAGNPTINLATAGTAGTYGSATQIPVFTTDAFGRVTSVTNTTLTNAVSSVFGRTGAVVATEGDYTLTQLGDVTITSPVTDQVLQYNGTTWVNAAISSATGGTVTSVAVTGANGISVTGSPITSAGTIALTLDAALDNLSDVVAPTPSAGQLLSFDGSNWVPIGGYGAGGGTRTWAATIASQTGTTTITPAVTPPLSTAGTQIMTQTLTPPSTSARYVISLSLSVSASINNAVHTAALFRDGTYIGAAVQTFSSGGNSNAMTFLVADSPATTSPVTYTIRYGTSTGTWYVNRRQAENTYGGVNSGWQIQEY